jgi:hypothetical protein
MLEDPAVVLRDMTLENPIRAIREISHDLTCTRRVRLANGREASALEIQSEYLTRALRYAETHDLQPQEKQALEMWEHVMTGLESDPFSLGREVDWVTKHNLIEAYRERDDLTLENPIRAIREISHDITCRRKVRLANGRELSAVEVQAEYLNRALQFAKRKGLSPLEEQALAMWEHVMTHLENDPLKLTTEIDWVIKHKLISGYMAKHDLPMDHPRVAQLDLAYHDVNRQRGVFYVLQKHGRAARITTDPEVFEAKTVPPQTTRAKLRGDFIKAAQEHRRDFTVDWVHLKLNDQAQRTVLCKDPFAAVDARVDRLIEGMRG